jgi:hypothetical protein
MWLATPVRFTVNALVAVACFFLAGGVMAGGNKGKKVDISFHIETEASDNPKMIFPHKLNNGQTRYFRRLPEISTKDVVSYSPCPSDAGDGYCAVFRLRESAAKRLAALTNVNQGKWLVAQVNGRLVDAVIIDQPINDGVLVVWKGITLADLSIFDKSTKRSGEDGKKNKKD